MFDKINFTVNYDPMTSYCNLYLPPLKFVIVRLSCIIFKLLGERPNFRSHYSDKLIRLILGKLLIMDQVYLTSIQQTCEAQLNLP